MTASWAGLWRIMAAGNGRNGGLAKWFSLGWPVFVFLATLLVTGVSIFYTTKETILQQVNVRIEQTRTEERAYQEELRSRYPTIERMTQWQQQEQGSINELRIAIALLQQEVHEWHRAAR